MRTIFVIFLVVMSLLVMDVFFFLLYKETFLVENSNSVKESFQLCKWAVMPMLLILFNALGIFFVKFIYDNRNL